MTIAAPHVSPLVVCAIVMNRLFSCQPPKLSHYMTWFEAACNVGTNAHSGRTARHAFLHEGHM